MMSLSSISAFFGMTELEPVAEREGKKERRRGKRGGWMVEGDVISMSPRSFVTPPQKNLKK